MERENSELMKLLVPKHIYSVPRLPKTPSGKIQKFKLKERAERVLR